MTIIEDAWIAREARAHRVQQRCFLLPACRSRSLAGQEDQALVQDRGHCSAEYPRRRRVYPSRKESCPLMRILRAMGLLQRLGLPEQRPQTATEQKPESPERERIAAEQEPAGHEDRTKEAVAVTPPSSNRLPRTGWRSRNGRRSKHRRRRTPRPPAASAASEGAALRGAPLVNGPPGPRRNGSLFRPPTPCRRRALQPPPLLQQRLPPNGSSSEKPADRPPAVSLRPPQPKPKITLPPSKEQEKKGEVIAFANQKGGVAKTTTTLNLAVAFAEAGHRVLAVDMDPQGNLTMSQGIDPDSVDKSMYDVLVHHIPIREVIRKREIDVACASIDLAGAEIAMSTQIGRERSLEKALKPVLEDYDFVCIDTPPSLGLLTINALTAADKVIVPVQCEYLSMRGLDPAPEHAVDDPARS